MLKYFLIFIFICDIGYAQTYELSTNNVGINTASPTTVLGVGGNLSVGSATYTSYASPPTNGAIIQGNVGIGSVNPGTQFDVNGTVRAIALQIRGGTSSQFLKGDGSTDSSTYLTGNQSITLSSDITGSGTTAITTTLKNTGTAGTYRSTTFDAQGRETSGTNPTTFSGYGLSDTSANLAAALTDEVGTGFAVFNASPNFTGNVGIGSLAPGATLDVNGTVRVGGFTLSGNGAASGFILESSGSLGIGTWVPAPTGGGSGTVNSGTANQVGYYASSTTAISGSSAMYISGSASGNNIGIGSVNPGTALDVNGTVRASYFAGNASYLTNLPITLTTTGTSGASTYTQSTNTLNIPQYTGGSSQWTTTNTQDVYLPSNGNVGLGTTFTTGSALTVMNGNVGIGTWAPTQVLVVKGVGLVNENTRQSSFSQFEVAGNIGLSGAIQANGGSSVFNSTSATVQTSGQAIFGNGFGGTGTTFQGATAATSNLKLLSTTGNGTTDSIQLLLGNNGATTGMMLQDNSGAVNVGIGSVNPIQNLDVWGTVHLQNMTTGTVVCITTAGLLGHCTSAASCTSTCTCTCTVN